MSLLHPFYRNPFYKAKVQVGRVDMGVDYHGTGPICAIGRAKVVGDGGQGWPGGHYLCYRLLRGRHKGKHVYVAEAIRPVVRAGQTVRKGQVVAYFTPDSAPGASPGIETGWSSPIINTTLAAEMGQTGGAHHEYSPAGLAFARFLHRIGAPSPIVSVGPEYPHGA